MKPSFMIALGCFLSFIEGPPAAQEPKDVPPRGEVIIRLSFTRSGIGNGLKSQAIDSQEKYDAFLKEMEIEKKKVGADRIEGFLRILIDAKLDFAKESLVLIRWPSAMEARGYQEFKDKKLICVHDQIVPDIGGSEAPHYDVFTVRRGMVTEVEIWEATKGVKAAKPRETLRLPAK
jgi:hypothetical protein